MRRIIVLLLLLTAAGSMAGRATSNPTSPETAARQKEEKADARAQCEEKEFVAKDAGAGPTIKAEALGCEHPALAKADEEERAKEHPALVKVEEEERSG